MIEGLGCHALFSLFSPALSCAGLSLLSLFCCVGMHLRRLLAIPAPPFPEKRRVSYEPPHLLIQPHSLHVRPKPREGHGENRHSHIISTAPGQHWQATPCDSPVRRPRRLLLHLSLSSAPLLVVHRARASLSPPKRRRAQASKRRTQHAQHATTTITVT